MTVPPNIQQAIQAYYAERITDEQLAALEDWFREDEANIKVFAEHGLVEWHMLCEHEKQDAAAILATLREAEEKAEPDFSLLDTPASFGPATPEVKATGSFSELFSLAGYLAAKTLRSIAAAIGSLAAVLVIGLVLYLAFTGPDNAPEGPETAKTPSNQPGRDAPGNTPTLNPIVASLTAQRDAQWAEGAAAPVSLGSPLRAGTRLTLTQGFAEITTEEGAVVILEAPATVELMDDRNALRLHAGKLVGICETESSKGFVVWSAVARITDIGTRFGVSVDRDDTVDVEVFDGEVIVDPLDHPAVTPPLRLQDAMAGRVTATGLMEKRDAGQIVFNQSLPDSQPHGMGLSGDVRLIDTAPSTLLPGALEADEHAWLIQELQHVVLPQELTVLLTKPGEIRPIDALADTGNTHGVINSGISVNSYLLHFDATSTEKGVENIQRVIGEIDFGARVLGVILYVDGTHSSDALLGLLGTAYPDGQVDRGFEGTIGANDVDTIQLLDDQQTIRFRLNATVGIDQVRILVEADANPID
ncbi:MAG: FecR domain-containing protein [Planctomycetota bacterium]